MSGPAPASDQGVYGITVAAQLVGMEVQSLRLYESRGLLKPDRTEGGTRRYSEDDLARLRRIAGLLADGVNLAGIRMLLELQDENHRLRGEIKRQGPPRRGR
ncbi:MerR family transcriptional regulator [Terrabacter sp. NPDC080008]|uniref:MerR family transcriptional regulator n=1 Tax=Terrabacter sp. NPDC080008 TaxID=3155176 RepID=UPI00344FAD0F